MAKPRTIGNMIAPPRFLAFLTALIVALPLAVHYLHRWALGAMAAFDVAAVLFLLLCLPLLGTREAAEIRDHAARNDANRTELLGLTGIVMAVLLIAIAAEFAQDAPELDRTGAFPHRNFLRLREEGLRPWGTIRSR